METVYDEETAGTATSNLTFISLTDVCTWVQTAYN